MSLLSCHLPCKRDDETKWKNTTSCQKRKLQTFLSGCGVADVFSSWRINM